MHKNFSKFFAASITALFAGGIFIVYAQNAEPPPAPKEVGYPLLESPHFNPIAINGKYIYVTNTPSSTVDVIDRESDKVVERIHVGIDPVSIAVRPDGKEVWVSNHVSDSVSVIDTDPQSPTYHVVIATIQEFDANKATSFDEPVGIAFASNEKAYVALSSENKIAVIDVRKRQVSKKIKIDSQDPRGILVKNGYLYVIPFESGNQTQLSGGNRQTKSPDNLITFDAFEHFAKNNNVLSLGYVEDIVSHYLQPDFDLFIYDTQTDEEVHVYDNLGTLLYGLTVDSKNNIFIAQTDARNEANGKAGTKKHNLKNLENRPYLNQITKLNRKAKGLGQDSTDELPIKSLVATRLNLEPLPPQQPSKNATFATPYAISASDDDKNIVVSSAGSNHVFIMDSVNGNILSKIDVGAGPVGLALESFQQKNFKAWVYNAFDNSVSKVNLDDKNNIKNVSKISLDDPTDSVLKKGREYFNSAAVSSTGTFSCASCHPNGHMDQVLWVLDTPIVDGGKQIQPRNTMPIRGLRDTEPFHWDGTQGDPYGGINSTTLKRSTKANCNTQDPINCIKSLIDGNLNSTMKSVHIDEKSPNTSLTKEQVNMLAVYNLSVPYPPAQKRSFDNKLSGTAVQGFDLFHIKGDKNPKHPGGTNICGDCHRMPFWTSTNTPGENGMDAPTWRAAYDRHLLLPQGRNNIIDFPWIKKIANRGRDEFKLWQLSWSGDHGPRYEFDPIWSMVLEGSTGFSGAFARQLTISASSLNDSIPVGLIDALEEAAKQGSVVLELEGAFIESSKSRKVEMQFDPIYMGGVYVEKAGKRKYYKRSDLFKLAEKGSFVGTFTGRHGAKADLFKYPQPAIWALGPIQAQRGKQDFPVLKSNQKTMILSGRHFKDDAYLFVDGQRVNGTVRVMDGEKVTIALANLPPAGMHFLQVQEPEGRISNDFIFHVK
jgi:YVTN family beta-propeller protein